MLKKPSMVGIINRNWVGEHKVTLNLVQIAIELIINMYTNTKSYCQ
jgi:hypothetical protein